MSPTSHAIISTALGMMLYSITRSMQAVIGVFIGGVLIDADHLIDYFLTYKRFAPLKVMYRRLSEVRLYYLCLILHSYEIVIILWVLVFLFAGNRWLLGLAWGASVHLACDQLAFFKKMRPGTYFLSYRLARKFRVPKVLKKGAFKEVEDGEDNVY